MSRKQTQLYGDDDLDYDEEDYDEDAYDDWDEPVAGPAVAKVPCWVVSASPACWCCCIGLDSSTSTHCQCASPKTRIFEQFMHVLLQGSHGHKAHVKPKASPHKPAAPAAAAGASALAQALSDPPPLRPDGKPQRGGRQSAKTAQTVSCCSSNIQQVKQVAN